MQFDFNIGKSTVAQIVKDTCQICWKVLQPTEMSPPTMEQWLDISEHFYKSTNFPNCLGSIDGKHIRCKNPQNSGSYFFNYKKYYSIILMAVVDSNLSFVCIDVGAFGRESDSNVFKQCPFGKKLYANQLNIPEPKCLPNTDDSPQPYVFVADEAFGLHKNLLRPYPGRGLTNTRRIFNYRLSRARRTVECAFGVLSNKWRVLHTPLLVEPDFADDIIKACCILHNFVRKRDGYNFEDMDTSYLVDGLPNRGPGVRSQGIEVRDFYAEYFMGPGSVPFQYNKM